VVRITQYSAVFVLMCGIIACVDSSKISLHKFPTDFQTVSFSLSDIFSELEIIQLDNIEPITKPLDIIYSDSTFIIPTWTGKIFRYYRDGTLIDVVDMKGSGPGEYSGIVDLIIHDDSIYINVGAAGKKILVFDYEYNFHRAINYPYDITFGKLIMYHNSFYMFTRPLGYMPEIDWVSFDLSGNVITVKPFDESVKPPISSWMSSLILFENSDTFYVYRDIADTIFAINEVSNYHPAFLVNRNFNSGAPLLSKEELASRVQKQAYRRRISNIIGLGKYWLAMIDHNDRVPLVETILFDTEQVKTYLLSSEQPEFGTPFNLGIPFTWVGAGFLYWNFKVSINGDEYIACFIDAYKVIEFARGEEFINSAPERPDLKQKFQEIANTLTIDDNPVLILLKLK